jgi:hypothetical protein
MCFNCIIVKPKTAKLPKTIVNKLKAEMRINPHGYGILKMNTTTGKTSTIRTLTRIKAVNFLETNNNYNVMHCHFRLASAGKISNDNIHMWEIDGWYFSHNGTVSAYTRSQRYYNYYYYYGYPLVRYVNPRHTEPNSNADNNNNNNTDNNNTNSNNNNSNNSNTINNNNNNNNNDNKDNKDKAENTVCTCDLEYSDSYQMFHAEQFQNAFKQLLHGKYAKMYEYLDNIGFYGVIMANNADKAVIISTKPFHIYNINKILIISNTDLQLKHNAFNINFRCPYTQYTGILIFSMHKMGVIHKYQKPKHKLAIDTYDMYYTYNKWYNNYMNRWLP